jgi:hypothetical protein
MKRGKGGFFTNDLFFFRWSLSALSDFPLPVFISSKIEKKHTEIL